MIFCLSAHVYKSIGGKQKITLFGFNDSPLADQLSRAHETLRSKSNIFYFFLYSYPQFLVRENIIHIFILNWN